MNHTTQNAGPGDGDMSCHLVASQLPAYLDGTLPSEVASRLEWHAALCVTCEALLEAATARAVAYAPALPESLKVSTLAAVDAQRQPQHGPLRRSTIWRRGGLAVALAAAAVLVIAVMARGRGAVPDLPVVADSGRVAGGSSTMVMSNVMREAESMASVQAAPEFSALDAAMQELDAALEVTPDDVELRRYRSTIRTRRDELERRVRDAAS
jgi:anti-sigma factor RsiW